MIVHIENLQLPLACEQLLSYLKSITAMPYQPFRCGFTHLYEIKNFQNFRLLEGVAVPSHSDGIAGYRPILMLHNPGNSYIVRGTSQTFPPQQQGTMIVLDIDARHEVRSKDPNGGFGAWAGLVWGHCGEPLLKTDWEPQNVAEQARKEFTNFCHTIES
ncbi:hypothetical protein U2F10_33095 [Leptothoe sp. EHU-05/26/07-4]|uniref:Aspartyl/asparaginy/proline hydroxylase domain-containing protein n=1 Tax=Adonisia turfae CCMR0081 TaxID=2292702 RepID=A0A6M0RI28_9CYAN|nr:hypothetical protein [Adonisia turfae]NEZ55809.1 hypothetical protein [Adonisia turfae CCMR0081]